MTDANDLCETVMREPSNVVSSDTGEIKEAQESFSFHEDMVSDDIPASLLSYFETSKSRAAVCERFILEELEDFTAPHYTEDMMSLSIELEKDMMKPNNLVTCETENEENNSSAGGHLFPVLTDEYMGCEKSLEFEEGTLKSSTKDDEIKKSSEYQREHIEKQHCEEKQEQRRQRERDFQEELRKIMEAEKLRQKELELMEKRAQEKLEHELLLQQEVISSLQKRVEEERKMVKEEQERVKEERKRKREEEEKRKKEEDKRKREVEKMREMERKRMEDEMRMKKEEEEKIKLAEMRLREEQRKKEEVEKRRMEKEEKRKKEEEKIKVEEDMRKKEEERKIKEILLKEVEKKRQMEAEGERRKENEDKIKERERNREREEEETRKKEEEEKMIEVASKMEDNKRRKNEEEIGLKEEGRHSDSKDNRREEEVKMKQEEMRKEEETGKSEIEKMSVVEQMKRKENRMENRETEDIQLKEDKEKKTSVERRLSMECKDMRREEEKKTKEEEQRKWQEEEMRQQEEQESSNMEEEIRLRKEKEWNKAYEAEDRKIEHERNAKNKEKINSPQEEVKSQQEKDDMRKMEDGRGNVESGKMQIKEGMRNNEEESIKTEEKRLKEEEERNKIIVQGTDKEERLMRAKEPQERNRENDTVKTPNDSRNNENTRNSLSSQLEDSTTLTSSSPGPLDSESTDSPTSFETVEQYDLNKDISLTSRYKTKDPQDATIRPCTSSGSFPMCLPEHTEQKRLSWMKDCIPWSKLSLQNKRNQKGRVRSRSGVRRAAEAGSLPPLCPHTLLQSVGCKSLQEVTTVTLEDLPGCSLSTLAQCTHLQSLTLRRCGLKSLEGISQLTQLCYIDVQENDISFVDCENMTSLRVLRLGHNKLTSIHGLSGAENLDVLDLSHNSITRIAGLESMRSLQKLSVDHNQLISTKGLRDVYTLLHLDCSHNHLPRVEGLENSALLQTLDLRANSLTEPPGLNNHILLRELHLDDNSVSSLQGLVDCWLPLMHHFSVAQNRITLLPSMSDFVSLANLDLRFNCMSELQNVCESLEGCQFLQEVHLTGNPLQQESGWRSTLQKAVAGLRAIDGQETHSILSAPAVQQVSLASGSFLMFCQAQLKQTRDLQQQHSRELSNASSHLDAVKTSLRHFTETLKLAVDQRFAHEYGDTTVSSGQTTPENTLDLDSANAEKLAESTVSSDIPSRNDMNRSYWTLEEKSSLESWCETVDTVTTVPKTGLHSSSTKEKSTPCHLEMAAVSNHQDLDPKNTAAVVIQQWWRKYRQKCGNISSPPTAEKGGRRGRDEGKPESGPSYINRSVVGQDRAATIIQAFWRGFTLRRRLGSALAVVACPDSGEDETFEEVDVDEFVFDEAALEKHWTLPIADDSPSRHHLVSEQPRSLKPPGPVPETSQCTLPPPPLWRPKQAWVAGEQVDSPGHRISPESSNRSKSPASASELSGLSARSEKILEEWGFTNSHTAVLMLKRAQKMKKQPHKKHRDPSVRLALFGKPNYQHVPVNARNRPAPNNRNYMKVCEAELGRQRAERTEQMKQEQAQQWLHTQSDRDSESEHFLPEISSDILNGGRVQLVADPGYTERLHHASGLWANSSLAAQPSKERNYPRRNSLGHARKEVPSPKQVTSAPLKKERISFRDNPVQLSGGWGGGKRRDKVLK